MPQHTSPKEQDNVTMRPSLTRAVAFIALNDDPTYQGGHGKADPRELEHALTVVAASEALGVEASHIVCKVLRLRLSEGLVHPDDEKDVRCYLLDATSKRASADARRASKAS